MDETRLRQLLGQWAPEDQEDVASLIEASNADSHEGAEWLPRYKAALRLLALHAGLLTGVMLRLKSAWQSKDGQRAADAIDKKLQEANRLWQAHLNLIADQPTSEQAIAE